MRNLIVESKKEEKSGTSQNVVRLYVSPWLT
uniref:Uncharacterized protein n=1 Tax=Arundo donax TaxID=35708 RepID=A0A0A9ART5_ARUDO